MGRMKPFTPSLDGVSYKDHTADIWMVCTGDSPGSVLSRMVDGLYGAIADGLLIGAGEKGSIALSANSLDVLMVDLVSEALYYLEAEGKLLTDPKVVLVDGDPMELEIECTLCPFEIPPGAQGLEIKAVAYHGAYLKESSGQWEGRVLLDI